MARVRAIRFLADEDLRYPIIADVRRQQPDIEIHTIGELGLKGTSDDAVLELAQRRGWITVSHDANTMTAEAYTRIRSGRPTAGLIVAAQNLPTRLVSNDLILIWTATSPEEWIDRVVYLPI